MKKVSMILAFTFVTGLQLFAQEQRAPSMPKDHFVRSQVDGYMGGDVRMISDFYHPEVVLISYPGNILAEGLEAAKKYWTDVFAKEQERNVEQGSIIDLGDKAICNIRQFNTEKGIMVDRAIIIEIKEEKIFRVMMIN